MNVKPYIDKICSFIEANEYAGYDPYDALNSPVLRAISCGRKYGRIAATQLLKRLPVNLRPILGIKKEHNPKGIGLFLWGYAKLYKVEKDPKYLGKIDYLFSLLESLCSRGYCGNCWGYNFDWQSRSFYIPKFTPTIVNSAFIGHALLDTYAYTGNEKALKMALPIKDFILNDLNRLQEDGAICFSYTPIDKTWVHNANLLGASLLIRLYELTKEEYLREIAFCSLEYSMRYQHEDGSWYYAETDFQKWVDSFHTGFNLQAIKYFLDLDYAEKYRDAYEKGVEFYAENFFLEDGTPKYYHDRIYPIDIHSPAQAIVFFSIYNKSHRNLLEKVLRYMMNTFYNPQGYFYFRKTARCINKIPYIRWGQAWAFHGLTSFLLGGKNG